MGAVPAREVLLPSGSLPLVKIGDDLVVVA